MRASRCGSAGLPGLRQRPDGGPFALGSADTSRGVLPLLLPAGPRAQLGRQGAAVTVGPWSPRGWREYFLLPGRCPLCVGGVCVS